MTTPYNLTREVQGTLLKPSQSQSKMGNTAATQFKTPMKQSPMKIQTNYMNFFGKNVETEINMRHQYMQKERGLMAHIKYIYESYKNESEEAQK